MSRAFLQFVKNYSIVAAVMLLTACHTPRAVETLVDHITPYHTSVVQGNFVSRKAAQEIQIGMSKEDVTRILGTPLLIDPFHPDRWDYVFYFKRRSTPIVSQRHFIVYFKAGRVVAYRGGEALPSEDDLLKAVDGERAFL